LQCTPDVAQKCVAKNTFQLANENTVKDLTRQPKDHFASFCPIIEGKATSFSQRLWLEIHEFSDAWSCSETSLESNNAKVIHHKTRELLTTSHNDSDSL